MSFLRAREAQKRIAAVALICAVGGALYGMFGPEWYQSVLTVVPAKAPSSGAPMLGAGLGGLAAAFAGASGGTADAARITAVLQSVDVSDAVVRKFDLWARYGEKTMEAAREKLWEHCGVKTLAKPNLVQVACEDRDPHFVQEMLGYFADYGNQVFRRVNVSSASEEVRFLEKRIAELGAQADEAAARMREFQEKHQIVDLDSQAKAVVSSAAGLNAQRIAKQMELEYARKFSSRDEAGAKQLESQLSVVKEKLRDLEEPRAPLSPPVSAEAPANARRGGLFPAALAVPKLRAEYEKLYRDRKVAEATLVFALDRLEGAKAAEARDVSTFQVLDPPALPTRKSRPEALQTALLGALLGFAGASAHAWWKAGRLPAP